MGAQPPPLLQDGPPELPKIRHVAAEQAPWFLKETEDPFSPAASHPPGRPLLLSRQKIDGCSHANGDRHAQRTVMHGHHFSAFGQPKETNSTSGRAGRIQRRISSWS